MNYKTISNRAIGLVCSFALVLTLVLTLVLGTVPASACDPLNCNPEAWTYKTATLVLPDYPDCPLTVSYQVRACNGGVSEIRVTGFGAISSSHPDCQAMEDDLFGTIEGQINEDGIKQAYRDLLSQLVKDEFVDFYNDLLDEVKPRFECPNGQRQYSGVWSSCAEFEVCFDVGGPWTVEMSKCSDGLCCLQEITICMDPVTGETVSTETFFPAPDDCGTPLLSGGWPCLTYGCIPFCEGVVSKGSSEVLTPLDAQFGILQNLRVVPNPLVSESAIRYSLGVAAQVEVVLFDALGRQVATLFNGPQPKGGQTVNIPAVSLINGMYSFHIRVNGEVVTGSIVVAR